MVLGKSGGGEPEVRNEINGSPSGHVLQAGTITGDVYLNSAVKQAPIPRQLPPAPPWFAGRERESAMMTAALDDSGGPVTAVVGSGGIGKTSLALHWAHRNLDRFPDGQLYVDLRAHSPSGRPMELATAVRCLLDGLGVDHHSIPADFDAQVGRYRSLVAGRRMLVLLDNVRDAAQVTALLPDNRMCTTLVTSRNRLDGLVISVGARTVPLTGMSGADAHALLVRRLGEARVEAEPDAVTVLEEYCAGMPLALAIVAGRASAHPSFPLSALADELRDATTRVDAFDAGDPTTSLASVLSWSYDALTQEQARAFELIGLAPAPNLSVNLGASLLDLSTTKTRSVLRALDRLSLVREYQPDRWRMHDLVRLYAANRAEQGATPDLRDAAVRRFVDHYLHTALACDAELDGGRVPIVLDDPEPGCRPEPVADRESALVWFSAEHGGLLATRQLAVRRNDHLAVWRFTWALHTFHWQQGHFLEQVAGWRSALAAAEHLDDPVATVLARRLLGSSIARIGEPEEAVEHLLIALTITEGTADVENQAHTHRALARAWERLRDDEKALAHAKSALDLYCSARVPRHEADALDLVSRYETRLGRFADAEAHCSDALVLYRSHRNVDGEATTLDSLGYLAHRTGDDRGALEFYRRALDLFHGRNASHEAQTVERVGDAHARLGEADAADTAWRRALALYDGQQRVEDADRVRARLADHPGERA
ncbi:tetratricopeptide repeat protein [Umezawaea sp. Da 62-37]|uniref:ATP-binding protein n=1 Tax=Umezawaea sp. Da 62-37 TaxID=3075927 RepID=UPI0028F744D7|nr:tetratricopeptide repeat protein [Umezawaea sp. Da 62-37]WNV85327.1 tetratricopeptide repeat protein [Umezawaea sp. Da 62-37]